MFCLEIEWLLGVCFAARTPADEAPDWPPQADRVFSALVASWGARGERPEERAALEWLESLAPPTIQVAWDQRERSAATAYVPVNDATGAAVLPERRSRQPRRFPAVCLPWTDGRPHLRLIWEAEAPAEVATHLQALAHDTSYLGHSSSLVRCRFSAEPSDDGLQPSLTLAAPYRGRLRELEALYSRHLQTADANARPTRATLTKAFGDALRVRPCSVFGESWLVFSFKDGDRPDLTAAAVVGRATRDALMSAWLGPIPEWLSGHTASGTPSQAPHLAIVPMATVGYRHANGLWQGLALILPRAIERDWRAVTNPAAFAERQTFERAIVRLGEEGGSGEIKLRLGALGVVRLVLQGIPELRSLDTTRYANSARIWSSVTPIALDRHPKSEDVRTEMAAIIHASCESIGLPGPVKVHVHKHAAIEAAPSAWPATGAPRWTGWARPGALAGRWLTHATIHFAGEVQGPVILGAGRYFGLGLCLPVQTGR